MLCIRFRILYTVPSRLKKEEEYIKPEECIEFSHIPAPPTPALKHPAGLQSAESNIFADFKDLYFVDFHVPTY